jgi:surface antigen
MDKGAMSVAYKASGGALAGGGLVIFGMTPNEFAAVAAGIGALVGGVVGLTGLGISWWYKHQHLQLARAKGEADQNG